MCLQIRFPVVVWWGPACSGITLGRVWWFTLGLVLHQGFTLGTGAPLVDPAGRSELVPKLVLVLPPPPLRHRCCSSPAGDGQTMRNQLLLEQTKK